MTFITDAVWNILVILDACRYDYFKEQNVIAGNLSSKQVQSSYTMEYLKTYFPGYYNLTYISANPLVNSKIELFGYNSPKHFAEIVDVWDFGWDETVGSVPPDSVTKACLPHLDKRQLIVHYIQPHVPYIGETRFNAPATNWTPNLADLSKLKDLKPLPAPFYTEEQTMIWRQAYRDNLQIALNEVSKLVDCASHNQNIVVTADHGELLGENGLKYHPGIRHPILNTVPWLRVTT